MNDEIKNKQELRDTSREYMNRFREYILPNIEIEKRPYRREKNSIRPMKLNS